MSEDESVLIAAHSDVDPRVVRHILNEVCEGNRRIASETLETLGKVEEEAILKSLEPSGGEDSEYRKLQRESRARWERERGAKKEPKEPKKRKEPADIELDEFPRVASEPALQPNVSHAVQITPRCCQVSCIVAIILVIILVFVFCFILIMVLAGFARVGVDSYGLLYSVLTGRIISDRTYSPGLYYVGIEKSFHEFPRFAQVIDLGGVDARSLKGLRVVVDISFQYSLEPSLLYDTVMDFSTDYEQYYLLKTQRTVMDLVSSFEAYDFFTKRALISETIGNALDFPGAKVVGFQLRNVLVGSQYASSLVAKEMSRQNQTLSGMKQDKLVELAEAEVVAETIASEVTSILAAATANATMMKSDALAYAAEVKTEALAQGLQLIVSKTPLTSMAPLFRLFQSFLEDQEEAEAITTIAKPVIVKFH